MNWDPTKYQVAATRYSPVVNVQPGDQLDALLHCRTGALESQVQRTLDLINERLELRDAALSGIDREELEIANRKLSLFRPDAIPSADPSYLKLVGEELRLARDRRREMSACWKDTADLALELSQLVERFERAKTHESLLRGGFGGS